MPCTEAAGRSAFTLLHRLQSPVAMKYAFIVQVSYSRPDDGFSLQKCLLPDSCCCTFLKGTTAYIFTSQLELLDKSEKFRLLSQAPDPQKE
jgi:hypothetical protein